MKGHAVLPTWRQRILIVIGSEGFFAETAKQLHHREVKLAVPAVCGGVDEPTLTVPVDDSVSCPEVSVQSGSRFVCGAELIEPVSDLQ